MIMWEMKHSVAVYWFPWFGIADLCLLQCVLLAYMNYSTLVFHL